MDDFIIGPQSDEYYHLDDASELMERIDRLDEDIEHMKAQREALDEEIADAIRARTEMIGIVESLVG